jgi:hypothetical protein
MSPGKSKTFSTAIAYSIIFLLILVGYRLVPDGSCNFGLGTFLVLLTIVGAACALVASVICRLRGKREYTGPILINVAVLAGILALIYTGRI